MKSVRAGMNEREPRALFKYEVERKGLVGFFIILHRHEFLSLILGAKAKHTAPLWDTQRMQPSL
jgi:hypothetical protein